MVNPGLIPERAADTTRAIKSSALPAGPGRPAASLTMRPFSRELIAEAMRQAAIRTRCIVPLSFTYGFQIYFANPKPFRHLEYLNLKVDFYALIDEIKRIKAGHNCIASRVRVEVAVKVYLVLFLNTVMCRRQYALDEGRSPQSLNIGKAEWTKRC